MNCFDNLNETFAILDPIGEIRYSGPGFADLAAKELNAVTGTNIQNWFVRKGASGYELPNWYMPPPWEGVLLHAKKRGEFRYRVELLGSDIILYLSKEKQCQEPSHDRLYSKAFHLNPGLSAITVLETGEHLDVNQAWLDALGYKRSEVIGRTARELNIWEQGDDSRKKIIEALRKRGRIKNLEAKLRTKDNRLLCILVNAEIAEDHGRQFALFSSHNITPIRQADQMCATLEQKAENMHKLAYLDGLTGLPNRRRFDESIMLEWRRCARKKKPLTFFLIDVDHFKLYNDLYGHQAGDDCLYAIGQALNGQANRPEDLVCRYGGEEFCCILPETGLEGGIHVAIRMQKAVNQLGISHADSPISPIVTISIGCASCIPSRSALPEELIQDADKNLYKAKLKGRNRIEYGHKGHKS